ncbi:FecR family protein [Acinetobacter larvae]|uniref:Iron dicitrate transport regulator FecR n=1 Tax=Acinetobacter larvae TaxID=1789224 RepID=A0A1B2LXU3_9GAMM|nr:FecR domain-containing protein [Acinetobacter larvae]AOA57756.1 hypothetical protein BFG52_04880 [Acinetobacter larvae]
MAKQQERLLTEAAEWMVKIQNGPLSPEEQQRLQHWCQQSKEHQRTWHKAQTLMQSLNGLPENYAPILEQSQQFNPYRWTGKLLLLLSVGAVSIFAWTSSWRYQITAEYSTAVGEQKKIELADGTEVTLNTNTALDSHYSATTRQLQLHYGEIMVRTAAEKHRAYRPFIVNQSYADIQALGTVFSVKMLKQHAEQTCVAVVESAVRIRLKQSAAEQTIHRGEQVCFDAQHFYPQQTIETNLYAWENGMYMADNITLQDLIDEMNRYQSHYFYVDSNIRNIRVSGSYPVRDPAALAIALQLSYPVQFQYYLNGYMTRIVQH